MTAQQMYDKLLMLTDELSGMFWTADQRWAALTGGQEEYTSIVLAQYKAKALVDVSEPLPEILRALYQKATTTISVSYMPLPPLFLYDLSVYLAGTYNRPLFKRPLSKTIPFEKANGYSGASGYYYSLDNSNINLEIPTPSSLPVTLEYLQKPTGISITADIPPVVTNPILPEYTHTAIVTFAFAQLLKKAKLFNEASTQYQEFISQIKYL